MNINLEYKSNVQNIIINEYKYIQDKYSTVISMYISLVNMFSQSDYFVFTKLYVR